jgi:hypothetical protein
MRRDPPETRAIFRRAVGQIFLVEELSEYGHAELDLRKLQRWNSVWVEPYLLRLIRRGRMVPSARWHRRQLAI